MGRNVDYFLAHGRACRLELETAIAEGKADASAIHAIPLKSHDGTLQSAFKRGWKSVPERDLFLARRRQLSPSPVEQVLRGGVQVGTIELSPSPVEQVPQRIAQLRALFKEEPIPCPSH